MPKKNHFNWGHTEGDEEVHHLEWPWDESDDEIDEDDESSGADDYASSRPWGIDNDGY